MEFEWDNRKAAGNVRKHGVSFPEAATVFADTLAITFDDPDHSEDEHRFLTFGVARTRRHVVVSHSETEGATRIISARLMTKRERKIYEEG